MDIVTGIGALAIQRLATTTAYDYTVKGIDQYKQWLHDGTKNTNVAFTPGFLPPKNNVNNLTEVLENTSKMNRHISQMLEAGRLTNYTRYGNYIGYRTEGGISQPVALMANDYQRGGEPAILHDNDPIHVAPKIRSKRAATVTPSSLLEESHKLRQGAIGVKGQRQIVRTSRNKNRKQAQIDKLFNLKNESS